MTTMKIITINVDRNVSFADYKPFNDKQELLVTSMFYTFQGEGPYAGSPAVFLRLAGCNIGAKDDCPFCDTRFNFDEGKVWSYYDLAAELNRLADGKARLLVVTGGEPLLQQESLQALFNEMYRLNDEGEENCINTFQIETNGYFVKPTTFAETEPDVSIVISPKVAATKNAYPKARDTWFFGDDSQPHVDTSLKYVLSADPDSPYHEVPANIIERCKESDTPLYVSAMAVYLKSYPAGRISSIWHEDEIDQKATADNYRYAAQYALKHGLLVSFQMHLFGAVE